MRVAVPYLALLEHRYRLLDYIEPIYCAGRLVVQDDPSHQQLFIEARKAWPNDR